MGPGRNPGGEDSENEGLNTCCLVQHFAEYGWRDLVDLKRISRPHLENGQRAYNQTTATIPLPRVAGQARSTGLVAHQENALLFTCYQTCS